MAAEYISPCNFEETDSFNKRRICKVYLVICSQVKEEKHSNWKSFAEIVLEAFDTKKESSVKPVQWIVSKKLCSELGFLYQTLVWCKALPFSQL